MTDAQLVKGVQQSDEQSIKRLLDRYYQPIMGYLFRMLNDHQAAEDVCQDVFIKLIKGADQIRQPEKLKSWLYRAATNTARDHLRKTKRVVLMDDVNVRDIAEGDPFESVEGLKERLYIADLLTCLSDDHREVIVMRYYQDLDLGTISEILGIPIGTVKSRMYYALRVLRAKVAIEGREGAHDGIHQRGKTSPSHVG